VGKKEKEDGTPGGGRGKVVKDEVDLGRGELGCIGRGKRRQK
jgi:hypothetical protein